MSFQLPFGVRVLNPNPVEDKYFNLSGMPYTSTTQVFLQVPIGIRHIGLTVNVNNEEFWFATGTSDSSLINKLPDISQAGGITGGTNGLTKSGANLILGGNLNTNTTLGLGVNNLIFTATTGTVRYGGDYSGNFDTRSIPDVGFITGLTSQRLLTSQFNIYSASTQTNINNRLLTSQFNIYSASTQTNINNIENDIINLENNVITGGTNGLTKSGANLILGGNLNTNTTLGLGVNNLIFTATTGTVRYGGDYSGNYVGRSLVDKDYVDSIAAGFDPKQAVLVATTTNLSTAIYNPTGGITGSGQFTSAPLIIDGQTLSVNDRILVKNQTNATQNGIYYVVSSGVWNRSSDMDGTPANEVSVGNYVFVTTGITNVASGWVVVGTGDTLTINVNPINWVQFTSSISVYNGGDGINIIGATIEVDLALNSGLAFNAGELTVTPTIAGNGLTFNSGVLNVEASNGLTSTGNEVVLGGRLNPGVTTISGNSGILLLGNQFTNDRLEGFGIATNNNIYLNSQTGNLELNAPNILLGISGRGISILDNGKFTIHNSVYNLGISGYTITVGSDNPTFNGITYNSNYSTNFTLRSLVDKEYVDNLVTTASTSLTANNGITRVGNNFRLGGTLTGDTIIDGDYNFTFGNNSWTFGTRGIGTIGIRSFTSGSNNIASSTESFIGGGYSNITNGNRSFIGGGDSNITNGNLSFIGGGIGNITNGHLSFIGGGDSNITSGNLSFIGGGNSNITSGNLSFIGGGIGNIANGEFSSIIGGQFNTVLGNNSFIIGGNNNNINIDNTILIGGINNNITDTSLTNHVIVPNLAITQTPNTNDNSNDILVYNTTTKIIEKTTKNNFQTKLNITILDVSSTLTNTNHVVLVNTSLSGITITLPSTSTLSDGQVYHIKDMSGNALLNNIIINGNGITIDGASTVLINTDYGSLYIIYSSIYNQWFTLAFIS